VQYSDVRLESRAKAPRPNELPASCGQASLVVMRPVLIVIDMVNACFDGWQSDAREQIVRRINDLTRRISLLSEGSDEVYPDETNPRATTLRIATA
jgi:hypothetical protein